MDGIVILTSVDDLSKYKKLWDSAYPKIAEAMKAGAKVTISTGPVGVWEADKLKGVGIWK